MCTRGKILFAGVPLPSPRQRVRLRWLAEEKLGFNFELEQLERSIHYVDPGADTKDGITIVPGADGGKSWRRAQKRGRRSVGRSVAEQLSLGGTLENKKNNRTMRVREKKKGWEKEGERVSDGESVTNGDAAATHEAKVPALALCGYIRDAANSARYP